MLTSGSEELRKNQDPQAITVMARHAGLFGKDETIYPKGIKTRAKRKLKALSSPLLILACLVHLPWLVLAGDKPVQRF